MDGAKLSTSPQLTWLRFGIASDGASDLISVRKQGVCHTLLVCRTGHVTFRLVADGLAFQWREEAGSAFFLPADGKPRLLTADLSAGSRATMLLLPQGHLRPGAGRSGDVLPPLFSCRDEVLVSSLVRLGGIGNPDESTFHGDGADVARRVVLRILQLSHGGSPDWYDGASVFDRRMLDGITASIDGNLRRPPALGDLAAMHGLSASHFARKLRQSTGLALHRFVNRRRVAAAVPALRAEATAISSISTRLGFASQSHFTRVFRGMTGMTPANVRAQFGRC